MTKQRILEVFEYDNLNGCFYWKNKLRVSKSLVGKKAGRLLRSGYIDITVDGIQYREHQLVFLVENGYIPEQIDHINGIKTDNRIENLRAVTARENCLNRKKNRDTGLKGITFNKKDKLWRAQTKINKKHIYIGGYKTKEKAYEEYVKFMNKNNIKI